MSDWMPIVEIRILEGRSDADKEALIQNVTLAVGESLNVPVERVRVLIQELPHKHWAVGGQTMDKLRR
ncbi:2-hydroxymuconate tautomerase [Brevibacillus invocatus]|uniref:2-hydroxymuconate tautomerase n=2 Tax=Brevibacillus TaxID=55080 RepID=UPI0030B866C8